MHCQMGRSRSATIAIAALMAAEDLSRDAAYVKVKGARPMAEPNQGFWEQLARFEAELRAKSTAALSGEAHIDRRMVKKILIMAIQIITGIIVVIIGTVFENATAKAVIEPVTVAEAAVEAAAEAVSRHRHLGRILRRVVVC